MCDLVTASSDIDEVCMDVELIFQIFVVDAVRVCERASCCVCVHVCLLMMGLVGLLI